MTLISSQLTRLMKWMPPAFFAGTATVVTGAFLSESSPNVMLALVICVVFFGSAWFHWWVYQAVADRVVDKVDHLLVRHGRHDAVIFLRDVEAVTMRHLLSGRWAPWVLDVRFRRPGGPSGEITFIPPLTWSLNSTDVLRDELADRARRLGALASP